MVDTVKVEAGKPGFVEWDFLNVAGTLATVDAAQAPVSLTIDLGAVSKEPTLGENGKWRANVSSAVAGLCTVSVTADVDLGDGEPKLQTFPLIVFDFPGDQTASGVGNVVGGSGE